MDEHEKKEGMSKEMQALKDELLKEQKKELQKLKLEII